MPDEDLATEGAVEAEEMSEDERTMAKLKEAIDVKVENIATLRKKLIITVPRDTIAERRTEQFDELKRDSIIPGFRKGRAPLRLVQKRFGQDVNMQLSSQILSSSYLAAVEKEDLKTIGDPLIWARDKEAGSNAGERLVTVEEAFDLVALPDEGDFQYSCEVEIRPELTLPKLEGIELKQPAVEIGSTQVDAHLQRLRAMRGHYEPVPDGIVAKDDMVVCNLQIRVGDEVLVQEDNCQLAARPLSYAGILLESLGDRLTGAKASDRIRLEGKVADDYKNESVRGKSAEVEIELLDIKRLQLPELDNAFAQDLGFEDVEEVRKWSRSTLEASRAENVRESKRDQVRQYLLERTEVELPEGLSQRQTDRVAARRMVDMARRGVPESEIAKQVDAIRAGAASDAIKDLKLQFILEKVAEEWDVHITEDEINGQIAAIAHHQNRRFDRVRDDLIRANAVTSLYIHVRDQKIIDRMIDRAAVVESKD